MTVKYALTVPVFLASILGCQKANQAAVSEVLAADEANIDPVIQIIPASTLEDYKNSLPVIGYETMNQILKSANTFWYDKDSMKPSYQDSVGDGSYTPIGARFNSKAASVIVPEGRKLFSQDGKFWSFPLGHTAGTDNSTNIEVLNFMSLPVRDGKRLPVVYKTINDKSAKGGLGLAKWTWIYPVGTTFGEMIFIKHNSGRLYPTELRTRTRYLNGWAMNSYRPFPTAISLVNAIKAKKPNYQADTKLKSMIGHLESNGNMTSKSVNSPAFKNIFTSTAGLDVLPDFGDEDLVKELLTSAKFVSAYGTPWKTNESLKAFAASTQEKFSIVPINYEANLIEVSDESCTRCHQEAGRAISDFAPGAILYGDVWGEDQIFSFHPYDESKFSNFNSENRTVRPELANGGLVVQYDAEKHPGNLYQAIDRN
jgi:hypothetical protein